MHPPDSAKRRNLKNDVITIVTKDSETGKIIEYDSPKGHLSGTVHGRIASIRIPKDVADTYNFKYKYDSLEKVQVGDRVMQTCRARTNGGPWLGNFIGIFLKNRHTFSALRNFHWNFSRNRALGNRALGAYQHPISSLQLYQKSISESSVFATNNSKIKGRSGKVMRVEGHSKTVISR